MDQQTCRLFFALRPDEAVATRIEHAVALIEAGAGVRGRWIKPGKYHMTAQFLGTSGRSPSASEAMDGRERPHRAGPELIIEQARVAAAQVRVAPFEIVLDRADTFGGHRQPPCVLRCTPESDAAVHRLHAALAESLAAAGLPRLLEERFTPHVTIAYLDRNLPEPLAVGPIVWLVRDFCLIESRGGESRHELLGHWNLRR